MKGEKVAAELLASMYDASLDAFREHQWIFDLYPFRNSSGGWNVTDAFTQANSNLVSPGSHGLIFHRSSSLMTSSTGLVLTIMAGLMPRYMGGMQMRTWPMRCRQWMASRRKMETEAINPAAGGRKPRRTGKSNCESPGNAHPEEFCRNSFLFPGLKD